MISCFERFCACAMPPFARCLCRGRRENLAKARSLHSSGNTAAAYEFYQRAVDISPATAKRFIEASTSGAHEQSRSQPCLLVKDMPILPMAACAILDACGC